MSFKEKQNSGISYPNSIVDEEWEYLDPTPDIHVLFLQFDDRFFDGKLRSVVVKWSPRMTVCAGLCRYEGRRSGHCSISLSVPLLKLRPRKDLVETLLHEMIHAFLFLTNNNRDRDGHGPEFQFHMHRINKESGTNITIYHSFHDEVRLYKQHWWKCNGPCQNRRPFYGLVKRSMNRAPGPNDLWWSEHQANCGGSFVKIKEPEGYGVKKKKENDDTKAKPESKKQKIEAPSGARDIRGFLNNSSVPVPSTSKMITPSHPSSNPSHPSRSSHPNVKISSPGKEKKINEYFGTFYPSAKGKSVSGAVGMMKNKGSSTVTVKGPAFESTSPIESSGAKPTQGGVVSKPTPVTTFVPFTGQGRVLGGGSAKPKPEPQSQLPIIKAEATRKVEVVCLDDSRDDSPKEERVPCPVCQSYIALSLVNVHLDSCLQ